MSLFPSREDRLRNNRYMNNRLQFKIQFNILINEWIVYTMMFDNNNMSFYDFIRFHGLVNHNSNDGII
jgi:hypothetical protein